VKPQFMPSAAQVVGVHGGGGVQHTLACVGEPHCWPEGQPPQLTVPPHPSDIGPHCTLRDAQSAAVRGTQPSVPLQSPGVAPPPPHVCGAVHAPQSGVRPPQPSLWRPQAFDGKLAQVFGTHTGVPASVAGGVPHWPGSDGSPPQTSVPVHVPHWTTPPQPSA
jgi:hypothetical protein